MVRTPWAPGAPALADAARAIVSIVVEGRSSDAALAPFESSPQRAAIRAITLGSVRWYLRLAPAVEMLLTKPRGLVDPLHALLVASAHQVEYSRNAPQATVHAAVDAARMLKEERATGLVNAVLRRFVSERAALFARVDTQLGGSTAHPPWLVKRLSDAWPSQICVDILEANNAHPPMVLRSTCPVRGDSSIWPIWRPPVLVQRRLIGRKPLCVWKSLLRCHSARLLRRPRFRAGRWRTACGSVACGAAGDACAGRLCGPGGKTGHLLEHTAGLAELVAVDIDAQRVGRIEENLRRLNRSARLAVADVRQPTSFWDGRPFDRILLDAPCSSTGVIRRHPDIKLLRRTDDIQVLATAQLEILRAVFGMLAVGGRLLYSTCSVLPDENQRVMEQFLETESTARAIGLPTGVLAPGALERGTGLQILPGAEAGTDGFYYACVEKTTIGI